MKRKLRKAPELKSEDKVAAFWAKHDSADFVDWANAKKGIFPNLRPTTRPIPLRLPVSTIDRMKVIAHKKDVPYQSLMKLYIEEGIERELVSHSGRR